MSNEERFRNNRFQKCVPDLPVQDCSEAIRYYCEILGFRKDFDDAVLGHVTTLFAGVSRGDCAITLDQHARDKLEHDSRMILLCQVDDVDLLHEEYRSRGVKILQPPTTHEAVGDRGMSIEDLNGHVINFVSPIRNK
jgi:uncharacterized glyoxalase superfamily protein PhnB